MADSPDVSTRPYVIASAAVSLDGYLDDTSDQRLLLSNEEDFARVDEVRAGVDAILVGAGTIRTDNPRLLVRSGRAHPAKVTITGSGDLDPAANFFTTGDVEKLVYTSAPAPVRDRLGAVATVVDGGRPLDLRRVLADLAARGVGRLMVEGGGAVHTQFLTAGVVDELHLAIAPVFVGEAAAPRFVGPGRFPPGRLQLTETRGSVTWCSCGTTWVRRRATTGGCGRRSRWRRTARRRRRSGSARS